MVEQCEEILTLGNESHMEGNALQTNQDTNHSQVSVTMFFQ